MPHRSSAVGVWSLCLLLALSAGTCMGDRRATARSARAERMARMRDARPARMRSRPQRSPRERHPADAPEVSPEPPVMGVPPPPETDAPAPPDRPAKMPQLPTPPVPAPRPQQKQPPAAAPRAPVQAPADAAPEPGPGAPAQPAEPPPASPPQGSPEEGDLRLVAQREINGFVFGGLQIFLDGAFGAVCGADFGRVDADVACRQLGFVGGGFVSSAAFFLTDEEIMEATAPFVLEVPDCSGSEDRLLDCPLPGLSPYAVYGDYTPGPASCEIVDDRSAINNAFVACGSASGPEDGQVRLVGGATSEDGLSQYGRLEFANAGGWGLVCDTRIIRDFTVADAQVACRSLGFTDGIPIIPNTADDDDLFFLPVWLASPECVGNESALLDCPSVESAFTQASFCTARDSIEVSCFSGENQDLDGRLRLAEGSSGAGFEFGRLEIFIRGFWSTVCDDTSFSPDAAQAACRILGFDGGAALQGVNSSELNQSLLPPGISNVDCDGSETSLLDCLSSNGFPIRTECTILGSPANDATVLACSNTSTGCDIEPPPEQGSVRLVGGFGTPCDPLYTGVVEIFNDGDWGAICNNGRGRAAPDPVANVICRQLGFSHGNYVNALVPTIDPSEFDEYFSSSYLEEEAAADDPPELVWLPRSSVGPLSVECQGPEQRLVDCNLSDGFLPRDVAETGLDACGGLLPPAQLHVACRQFPVP